MKISVREKIYLALGGGALILTGFYLYVVTPLYQGYLDIKLEIVNKSEILSRYHHLWNNREAAEKKLKAIQIQDGTLRDMFLKEKNESLAAAELQKVIEGFSVQSNVEISSAKVMGARSAGTFKEITIQLAIKSSLKNLRKFLYLVENSRKYLNIEEINLRVLGFKGLEKLESRMKISGFLKSSSLKKVLKKLR